MSIQVTYLKLTPTERDPVVIDEITAGFYEPLSENKTVHIERLDEYAYWCRIGDEDFHFRLGESHSGPIIELVRDLHD